MTADGEGTSDGNVVPAEAAAATAESAILFDLDGTLIDSVYQHVLAWRDALEAEGIDLPVWHIHRKIGMSGGLFTRALLRETGYPIEPQRLERLQRLHEEIFGRYSPGVRPLPGATELLDRLTAMGVPWAIATSGRQPRAGEGVRLLGIGSDVPVITRDLVRHAKPDPDLFLAAAAALGVPIENCVVVGDSVWDLLASRRARALGVGLLSGGYGQDELERAGAFRVYEDPRDLLDHLDEVGVREPGELRPRAPAFRSVAAGAGDRPLAG
jgi:HAD superfamily hydrolase (TIGR01509 family)